MRTCKCDERSLRSMASEFEISTQSIYCQDGMHRMRPQKQQQFDNEGTNTANIAITIAKKKLIHPVTFQHTTETVSNVFTNLTEN